MLKVSKLSSILLLVSLWCQPILSQRPAYLKLEFDKKQKPYVYYPVVKGDTQEDLCRSFGCTAAELRGKNHLSTGQNLTAGATLQIPVNPDKIIKKNIKGKYEGLLPVYYTVKKGETAYRIVKVNLKDDIDRFYERNKLENNQLKVGAEVLVGWIDLRGERERQTKELSQGAGKPLGKNAKVVVVKGKSPDGDEPTVFKKVISDPKEVEKPEAEVSVGGDKTTEKTEIWVNDKGVAYWQHGHRSNSNKYVLHNTAAINSIIELYNPMLKRTVRAKVIGRIPEETYRADIDVVLSEGAAESLGALDSRFLIEMKYKK